MLMNRRVEAVLLGPLNENLGNPDRVARLVAEMEAYYLERLRVLEARDVDSPRGGAISPPSRSRTEWGSERREQGARFSFSSM